MIEFILSVLPLLVIACIVPTTGLVYRKNIKFTTGVFLGTFLFLLSFGCAAYSISVTSGYNVIDTTINGLFAELSNLYKGIPGITEENMALVDNVLKTVKESYFIMFPSMLVTSALMWSYAFHMLVKGILALFRKDVSGFYRFCDFKMPRMAMFFTVISLILSMVFESHRVGYAFLNFASIVISVTAFCGLSIVDFWLRKKIRYSLLRLPIYVVGIVILSLIMIGAENVLAVVGMADSIFDFRTIKKKPNGTNL